MFELSSSSARQMTTIRGTSFNTLPLKSSTPLSAALGHLSHTFLFPQNKSTPEIQKLNERFNWQAARIYAVFEIIYNQHVVTKQDLPKLREIETQLDTLEPVLFAVLCMKNL